MLILGLITGSHQARMEALCQLIIRPTPDENKPHLYHEVIQWAGVLELDRERAMLKEWREAHPVSEISTKWQVSHQVVTGVIRRVVKPDADPTPIITPEEQAEIKAEEKRDAVNEYQAEVKASMNYRREPNASDQQST
jgi:hypothetical protein